MAPLISGLFFDVQTAMSGVLQFGDPQSTLDWIVNQHRNLTFQVTVDIQEEKTSEVFSSASASSLSKKVVISFKTTDISSTPGQKVTVEQFSRFLGEKIGAATGQSLTARQQQTIAEGILSNLEGKIRVRHLDPAGDQFQDEVHIRAQSSTQIEGKESPQKDTYALAAMAAQFPKIYTEKSIFAPREVSDFGGLLFDNVKSETKCRSMYPRFFTLQTYQAKRIPELTALRLYSTEEIETIAQAEYFLMGIRAKHVFFDKESSKEFNPCSGSDLLYDPRRVPQLEALLKLPHLPKNSEIYGKLRFLLAQSRFFELQFLFNPEPDYSLAPPRIPEDKLAELRRQIPTPAMRKKILELNDELGVIKQEIRAPQVSERTREILNPLIDNISESLDAYYWGSQKLEKIFSGPKDCHANGIDSSMSLYQRAVQIEKELEQLNPQDKDFNLQFARRAYTLFDILNALSDHIQTSEDFDAVQKLADFFQATQKTSEWNRPVNLYYRRFFSTLKAMQGYGLWHPSTRSRALKTIGEEESALLEKLGEQYNLLYARLGSSLKQIFPHSTACLLPPPELKEDRVKPIPAPVERKETERGAILTEKPQPFDIPNIFYYRVDIPSTKKPIWIIENYYTLLTDKSREREWRLNTFFGILQKANIHITLKDASKLLREYEERPTLPEKIGTE